MRPLRLLKHFSRYNAGEIAGFEETEAARLIANGTAVAYAPDGTAPADDKSPAPKPLADQTKAELMGLAIEELDLNLDPKMKQADMIAAIEDARVKKSAAPVTA